MNKTILEVMAQQRRMMATLITLKIAIENIEAKTDVKATEVYMCLSMLMDSLIRMTAEVSKKLLIKVDVDNLLEDLKDQLPPQGS